MPSLNNGQYLAPRAVANKYISDSFRGILRISPNDNDIDPVYPSSLIKVSTSEGYVFPLSLSFGEVNIGSEISARFSVDTPSFFTGDITSSGSANMNGPVNLNNFTYINGHAEVTPSGELVANGKILANGDVEFSDTSDVIANGMVTINSLAGSETPNFIVNADALFNGKASFNGDIVFDKQFIYNNDVEFGSKVTFTDEVDFTNISDLTVSGSAEFLGDTRLAGNTILKTDNGRLKIENGTDIITLDITKPQKDDILIASEVETAGGETEYKFSCTNLKDYINQYISSEEFIQYLQMQSVPVGTVIYLAMKEHRLDWLPEVYREYYDFCFGQSQHSLTGLAYNKQNFRELCNVICGPEASDSTEFNLPDLQNRYIRGSGDVSNLTITKGTPPEQTQGGSYTPPYVILKSPYDPLSSAWFISQMYIEFSATPDFSKKLMVTTIPFPPLTRPDQMKYLSDKQGIYNHIKDMIATQAGATFNIEDAGEKDGKLAFKLICKTIPSSYFKDDGKVYARTIYDAGHATAIPPQYKTVTHETTTVVGQYYTDRSDADDYFYSYSVEACKPFTVLEPAANDYDMDYINRRFENHTHLILRQQPDGIRPMGQTHGFRRYTDYDQVAEAKADVLEANAYWTGDATNPYIPYELQTRTYVIWDNIDSWSDYDWYFTGGGSSLPRYIQSFNPAMSNFMKTHKFDRRSDSKSFEVREPVPHSIALVPLIKIK